MIGQKQNDPTAIQTFVYGWLIKAMLVGILLVVCSISSLPALATTTTSVSQSALKNSQPIPISNNLSREWVLIEEGMRFLRALDRFLRFLERNKTIFITVAEAINTPKLIVY